MVLKALGWLLVPALGLLELGGHFYYSGRPPKLDEWRLVRREVAEVRRNAELVVIAPDWAEPNARYAFGDALMPLSDVGRADESARARAIEVSILGASAPELSGWTVASEKRAGKFRIRVLLNPHPAAVTYDFVDHVADAEVADVRGGAVTPCPWDPQARKSAGGLHGDPAFPGRRHQCAGDSHFVGVTVIEDKGWRGRRCLWASPSSTTTLSIRYHDVPVGHVIRGYGATPWWVERELRGGPIEVTVLVGGDTIGKYVQRAGDSWKLFELPVPASASPHADVEFRVESPHGRERQFCLQADTR
ncbi:MAG TPA: hypothetical protein VF395_19795 [Polyangiaceae bacterium]